MDKPNAKIETGPFRNYPDILTVKDLCRALQIGRLSAYKLLNTGAIHSFKIGKVYKIPKDSLIAYVNQSCNIEKERENGK